MEQRSRISDRLPCLRTNSPQGAVFLSNQELREPRVVRLSAASRLAEANNMHCVCFTPYKTAQLSGKAIYLPPKNVISSKVVSICNLYPRKKKSLHIETENRSLTTYYCAFSG